MTLERLKWIVVAAAVVLLGILEYGRYLMGPALASTRSRLVFFGAIAAGILLFSVAVFRVFEVLQRQLERRNQEILALHESGVDIAASLSLDSLLNKVVDAARRLASARYGALALYDEAGRIHSFITSGLTAEERRRLTKLPEGHGLLGPILAPGERLRLREMRRHPSSAGFPPGHPPIRSLLAVPIATEGPARGNLYLAEKLGGPEFTPQDEETLVRFATQAAIAIGNAALLRQIRDRAVAEERLRISHEMHDGLAQLLAYVNTKAQAVLEFQRQGRSREAAHQVEDLAKAAREIYSDVREGIFGLRFASSTEEPFCDRLRQYLEHWEHESGIEVELEVELDGDLQLPTSAELQLLRIAQESLANVRKHAHARRVRVGLAQRDNRLELSLEDDGVGFEPETLGRSEFPRFGLATMRERAGSVGGTLSLDSIPGRGTRVVVRLPLGTA